MKFINPFNRNKKPTPIVDKEVILKLVDKNTVRINYKNIYGDEEACQLVDWEFEPRATHDVKDINRYYLYDGSTCTYIIRLETKELVFYKDYVVVKIDKEFIQQIKDKLDL
mgnify:FL=1